MADVGKLREIGRTFMNCIVECVFFNLVQELSWGLLNRLEMPPLSPLRFPLLYREFHSDHFHVSFATLGVPLAPNSRGYPPILSHHQFFGDTSKHMICGLYIRGMRDLPRLPPPVIIGNPAAKVHYSQ